MSRYYFYIINILFCINLQAQEVSDLFLNESSKELLHKGKLLVRLESKDKKIQFLTKEMNTHDCNTKCRKRLEDQINDIIHTRDTFNVQFMESFKNYFKFCPVYFYYDKNHQELIDAQFKGNYFLDEKLNTINITTINKDSILILKHDLTPESENEGWLFQTTDGITLRNGFPFINEHNSVTLLNSIVNKDHQKLNCDYLIKRLNRELYAYSVKRE
jgi:hypothetical protein